MATKRRAPGDLQPGPDSSDQRAFKRQRPNASTKYQKKSHPVNALKNQIRDIRRLLERNDNLPANIRVEKERALKSAQYELDQSQRAKRRTEMIERFHKVRFFDRQKAMRRLKKAKKELSQWTTEDGDKAELVRKKEGAEVDVNYAIYCPLDQPYISLFPTHKKIKEDQADEDKVGQELPQQGDVDREGDREMWELVKKCMAEGTLALLREGKLTRESREEGKGSHAVGKGKREVIRDKQAKRTKHDNDNDGDNSDGSGGGFFE